MKNASVRAALEAIPTDAAFEAFCIDYFPATQRKFGASMDRTQRINLMLAEHGAEALAGARQIFQPRAGGGSRVFHIPHPFSQNFIGRDDTLALLRQQLDERRMVALWALGGSGKTQTAVAYAHRHRADYPVVLWLSADSAASFEQGLFELGQPLLKAGRLAEESLDERDPARVRQAVLSYLKNADDYLLICSRADRPLALKPIWPHVLSGHVLLTSTNQDIRRLGAAVVELPKLSLAESQAYFSRRHPAYDPEEQQALNELAQELDGMPLALAQAAAFLVEHQSRYTDYLRQYRKQYVGLLEQAMPENSTWSLNAVWALSIEQVEQVSPAALDLLKLCAMFHSGTLPEDILARPVPALGERLAAALCGASAEESDALALDYLLKPLLGHALIQRDRERRMLSLPRLVQQALLGGMSAAEQNRWAAAAVGQLNQAFPWVEFANWSQCRRLVQQIPTMLKHIQRCDLSSPDAVRLLTQGGYFLRMQAQYDDAETLLRAALSIQEKQLGGEHPDTAANLEHLGLLLRGMGRLPEAEPLLRCALAIRERALGAEHPDMTKSLCSLGRVLHAQGMLGEAELLLRRALTIRQQTPGTGAAGIARNLSYLAAVLRDQKESEEALPLYQKALSILEEDLGADHPDLAYVLHGFSALLLQQGNRDEAERALTRALSVRQKALPKSHPLIQSTRDRLLALQAKSRELRGS